MWWLPDSYQPHPLAWTVVVCATALAACTDLRSRRISNALTMPMLALGLVWALWRGGPWAVADAVSACSLLALPYVILFAFCNGGAGDAKLMGAIGAWLGLAHGLAVLLTVAIAGSSLGAVLLLIARRRQRRKIALASRGNRPLAPGSTDPPPLDARNTMPYGVAIFIGVCIWSAGMLRWPL